MDNATQLKKLREPFPPNQVSKLPKPTKQQTDEVKQNYKNGERCAICGGWHHPKVVHLDYVGHAALTDRLLDVDPTWAWEPIALDSNGLPAIDKDGGLWIRLTICGVTRLGYGDAQGKTGGDAMKERIGDALRNAAMRFGAALDLWHKGDLHLDDDEKPEQKKPEPPPQSDNSPPFSTESFDELEYVTDDQMTFITDLAKQAGVSIARICETAGIEGLEQLLSVNYEVVVNKLNLSMKDKK